jgi:hypothetical protein
VDLHFQYPITPLQDAFDAHLVRIVDDPPDEVLQSFRKY